MAKLPSFRRIFKTDYPTEIQPIIEKLSTSLNYGIEVLYDTLNNKVSLRDNINATVKDVDVTVDSNGFPTTSVALSIHTTNAVDGLTIIKAENLTNTGIYPNSGVFASWTQNSNIITLDHIAGLPANNEFRLRVVVYGN